MIGKGSVKRMVLAFRIGLKEKLRNPVLVALILFLPMYFIFLAGRVIPEGEVFVYQLDEYREMGEVFQASFTPVTASLVTGIFGLYTVLEAKETDERLMIAGYSPIELLVSRFGMILGIGSIVSIFCYAVMRVSFSPENVPVFFVMILILSFLYGALGVLIGAVMDKMPGVYTMLVLITMDAGVFQNAVFMQEDPVLWIRLLPAYSPMKVTIESAFLDSIEETRYLILSIVILLLVIAVAVSVYWKKVKS